LRAIPFKQAVKVVTEWAISAKCAFIEKPLDAATQANLVGVVLRADWPTHLAVPAAAEDHHADACQPRGEQAHRPQPVRLLLLLYFTHLTQPDNPTIAA
jgi:hypothetical protein